MNTSMNKKLKRTVVISEVAVQKAEAYSSELQAKTGIHLSNGAIFAQALDTFLKAAECQDLATQSQGT